MKRIAIAVMLVLLVGAFGCKSKDNAQTTDEGAAAAQAVETDTTKETDAMTPPTLEEPKEVTIDANRKYYAIIHTNKGDITAELYAKEAPLSVTNFKYLADKGYYNGQIFHRYVPGFVIQGGDPTATGAGGPGYTMPPEIGQKHVRGALAWARQGDEVNPEKRSNGSQFYFTLRTTPHLDGQYTVFGKVVEGMGVVDRLRIEDKIDSIDVVAE